MEGIVAESRPNGPMAIFVAIIPVVGHGAIGVASFHVVLLGVIASRVLQGWTIPWLARRPDLGAEA